ncbi:MAG: PQQ-binding-like beta-propeller repeat protein [Verrucomicrobiota bacterium]
MNLSLSRRMAVVVCVCGWAWGALGQTGQGFEKSSLAWRTALHFDPGAETPLRSLMELYQRDGRVTELVALYTQHVAQYPLDEGAAVVLARLYVALKDPQASAFVEQALVKQPTSALLKHVQAEVQMESFAPRALETLDEAVKLERKVPGRRAQWLGDLVKAAAQSGRDDLVAVRMKALVEENVFTLTQRVQWARRSLEAGLKSSAAAVLEGTDLTKLTGEEAVDALFVHARVALAIGKRVEAAAQARALLDLLAPDHWRRKEAVSLHWQTADEAQRTAALAASAKAWQAAPAGEAAALAHGDLLMMAAKRDEALDVWQKSLAALPASRLIEERIAEAMQSLRREDELLSFLAVRVQAQPERDDLKLRRARLLLQLGRTEEGLAALDDLLVKSDAAQRITTWLQTARWLRLQNLFGESARVLEVALKAEPQRWEVRKELAEVYVLLKRETEVETLFELEMGSEVTPEVRLEVAQFLIARKMWAPARRHLETWVKSKPGEFDARLLLARVEALAGQVEAAEHLLEECRQLCDTEARYAAWLTVAWERATELETTAAFVEQERERLWPKSGKSWDASSLQKLGLLAEQTMQQNLQKEAEALLRRALTDAAIPAESRKELRQRLISVLDGREDQRKALETEINTALEDAPELGQGDLRLRLALMYFDAQRHDLVKSTLRELDADRCEDTGLLQRGITAAWQLDEVPMAISLAERLVRLQPDERAHWVGWTSLLVESGDETKLRLALREMRVRAVAWKLGDGAQENLRRHLAASAWRTVGATLADPTRDSSEALLCLGDLEQTEQLPQRRLWLGWARGMLAMRTADEVGLADARAALTDKDEWVVLPDGLSLSLQEARRMLDLPKKSGRGAAAVDPLEKPVPQADYSKPGELAWSFESMHGADFQRWSVTPDGSWMTAQDSHGRLYVVDRQSGKLRWHRRLGATSPTPSAMPSRGGFPNGGEQVSYPKEWCVGMKHLCVLDETGLSCLGLVDGSLVWHVSAPTTQEGTQGVLARVGSGVLWWRAALGRLDAYSMVTGKMLWSCEIPALNQNEPLNPQNPMWLMSGICVDGERVLVWGHGTAVVRIRDGKLVWKASMSTESLSFPLQLDDVSAKPGTSTANFQNALFISGASTRSVHRGAGGRTPIQLGHALALPSFGFPGMYGATQGSPWLQWGGEGVRWLQGEGVWLLGQNVTSARFSLLGFPISGKPMRGSNYLGTASALGTAGRSLVVASESGVFKVLPDGSNPRLVAVETRDNSPTKHPMPAAGLDGTTVACATADEIQVLDAVSGTTLWQRPWAGQVAEILSVARDETLSPWQNLRWSSRGVALYDGRGRTLMVDWQALMAGGDIIVPAGTRKLLCLRCGENQEKGGQ